MDVFTGFRNVRCNWVCLAISRLTCAHFLCPFQIFISISMFFVPKFDFSPFRSASAPPTQRYFCICRPTPRTPRLLLALRRSSGSPLGSLSLHAAPRVGAHRTTPDQLDQDRPSQTTPRRLLAKAAVVLACAGTSQKRRRPAPFLLWRGAAICARAGVAGAPPRLALCPSCRPAPQHC